MGLLDDLLTSALSGGRQQDVAPQRSALAGGGAGSVLMTLLPVVLSMLGTQRAAPQSGGGGLGDILEQMQRSGYGDEARSWVGTGQNMPISPDAMGQIFGEGGLEEIAQRAGLTRQQTSQGLSELLPEVVDRVTPGGQEPDFDDLTRSVDDLRHRMGM
jgi:uncharacterized protein YidB (DUF937 family)